MKFDVVIIGTNPSSIQIIKEIYKRTKKTICVIERGPKESDKTKKMDKIADNMNDTNFVEEFDTIPQIYCNNEVKRIFISKLEGRDYSIKEMERNLGEIQDYNDSVFTYEKIKKASIKLEIKEKDKNYNNPVFYKKIEDVIGEEMHEEGVLNGNYYPDYNIEKYSSRIISPYEVLNELRSMVNNRTCFLYEHKTKCIKLTKNKKDKFECRSIDVYDKLKKEFYSIECDYLFICEDAIQTPKLLFVSGVGPLDMFKGTDIDIKIKSEHVGKNLKDLPSFYC